MTKRFQIDDDGDISEFDSNGKWVDCWEYANGKHWKSLCDKLNHLYEENEQLKEIIYEDKSQIIGEWSSHIQKDMTKLNKAYESDDINDLIRFCREG